MSAIKKYVLISCVLLLCVSAIAVMMRSHNASAIKEAVRKSTTHQPERLSELYFTDPNTVPHTYADDTATDFRISIRNLEGMPKRYDVELSVGTEAAVATQQVSLQDGEEKHINLTLPAGEYGERVLVRIRLANMPQEIRVWMVRL